MKTALFIYLFGYLIALISSFYYLKFKVPKNAFKTKIEKNVVCFTLIFFCLFYPISLGILLIAFTNDDFAEKLILFEKDTKQKVHSLQNN